MSIKSLEAGVNPPIFQAEWPKGQEPTFFGNTARILYSITPIGIVHNILFWLGRFLVHPAAALHFLDEGRRERLLSLGGRVVHFNTPDGVTLEGFLFASKAPCYDRKAIVFAPGNAYCMDHVEEKLKFFKEHVSEADLLFLNYEGVGKSKGSSSGYRNALGVYAACEYEHQERGVNPSKVLAWGHSLGGPAAVSGAAHFQRQHPDANVSVVNDRSFSSLSEAAGQIMGLFFYCLAHVLGWEIDARGDWDTLKGRKIVIYDKEDRIIPFPVSFFKAIEPKQNQPNARLIEMSSKGVPGEPHLRSFTAAEASEIGREVNAALLG